MRTAGIVCVLALSAASPARADGQWLVGASTEYVRDSRVDSTVGYGYYVEGPTGFALGLEAGRTLLPWLSASVIYQRTAVSGRYTTDPGTADLADREHRIGPRLDLWPVPGRLRLGAALVQSLRRSERDYRVPFDPEVLTHYSSDTVVMVQAGGVPVRWRRMELELVVGYSTTTTEVYRTFRSVSTFSIGLGVRWRSP